MAILVISKYEEDPIKIEGARVATTQNIYFSNTQGQINPQSEVGSGRNSKSSEMLWMSLLLPKIKNIRDAIAILVTYKYEEYPIKIEGARVATTQNNNFSNTQGQLTPQSEVGSS